MLADPKSQLYYPFQNTLIDGSGHGRDGTLGGSPACTFVAGGPRGRALYFPGTGYVATPSFGLPATHTVVVFAARVRCKANATVRQTFIGEATQNATGFLWCLRRAGVDNLTWQYSTDLTYTEITSTNFFQSPFNDAWLSLLVVCNYSWKNTYCYRNGALFSGPHAMAGNPTFPSISRVRYVGDYAAGSIPLVDGYLADVYLATLATAPTDAARNWNAKRLAMGLHPIW